jgi:hypothetical protein
MEFSAIIALIWVACGIAGAVFAGQKNRSQAGWFLGGFILGPLGLLLLLALPRIDSGSSPAERPAFVPSTTRQRIIPMVFVVLTILTLLYVLYFVRE